MRYVKPPDFKRVKELQAHYEKVEKEIAELLTTDASARTAAELNKQLQSALTAAFFYLSKVNKDFVQDELAAAFAEGRESVRAPQKLTAKEAAAMLEKQGYKYAKNGLSQDTYIELHQAMQSAGFGLTRRVNKIIEGLRKTGDDSVYNVQQAILKDLQSNGLLTVGYSNGAKQTLHSYAAMAARSARIESANIGAIGRALQAGTDLVKMTVMPRCCKLCGAYQGKVYSISGEDKRFPALFKTVLRSGYALPHPNCRHEFIPYFEEIESPEDVQESIKESKIAYDKNGDLLDVRFQRDIKAYAAWQEGNRQLNRELLEYQRMKTYYGKDAPYKTLASFRRASRAGSENFKSYKEAWTPKGSLQQKLNEKHVFIARSLGKADKNLREKFNIKSENIIITDRQYKAHIAQGANTHNDIFDAIKDNIPIIINSPDYIFESDKREDTVIYVSKKYEVQIIVKLNTQDEALSNTIITIFGCGEKTLKRLKKKNVILYEKSIDKD